MIGSVGRLDPVKNLGALFEALSLLGTRCPTARAVVVGEGPERQALIDRAHALGIGNVTHFTGHRSDVSALMAAFDVYVNCSTYEGVSLTILEAMATALPVVATAVGGNPEVVVDQETGLLVDERPRSLATAIATLASNPAQRQAMGDAGRWRVKRHFTIERMVNDYAAAYQVPRTSVTTNAAAAPARRRPTCDSKAADADRLRPHRQLTEINDAGDQPPSTSAAPGAARLASPGRQSAMSAASTKKRAPCPTVQTKPAAAMGRGESRACARSGC